MRFNSYQSKTPSQHSQDGGQPPATHFILQQQIIPSPQQPVQAESYQQMQLRPPVTAAIITPPSVTQIIGTAGFMEPQQCLAAVPVQPVAAFAPDATAAMLSPIPPTSPATFAVHTSVSTAAGGVVLTPTQNQVQDQLHRKHEELQHLIMQQQDELRRVQEQLLMARYGLLPSIVTLPFSTASSSTNDISSRCSSSAYLQHHQSSHSSHQYQTHPSLIGNTSQQQPLPQLCIQPDQKPIFHPNQQLNFTDTGQPRQSGDPTGEGTSYMQLTPVPIHHLQQHPQTSQQHQQQLPGTGNSMELLQYQMVQEQAHALFTSGMEQQQQQQQHQQQQHIHPLHHHHHHHQHHQQGSSLHSPGGSTSHSRSDV